MNLKPGTSDRNNVGSMRRSTEAERGFSLTELMIAMMVFLIIGGSVVALLTKSQALFRTEQGISEMDQNARLAIDFLTRDIQQSKENGLGLGPRFRSIHSSNGANGMTDELTIVSSESYSEIPAGALPLMAASAEPFSVGDRYVEVVPNSSVLVPPSQVMDKIQPSEEFVVSTVRPDGALQFDFVKVFSAKLTPTGLIGLTIEPVEHAGIQSEVPFGSVYEDGTFNLRPVTIKRYFIDRTEEDNPVLALSVNDGKPIPIARNLVAFQLRFLEVMQGEVEGSWVYEQSISPEAKTVAVEVTMTARTEISGDSNVERLVTLASVVRPRTVPDGTFGQSGQLNPGLPAGDGLAGGPGAGWPGDGSGGDGGERRGDGSGIRPGGSGGPGNGLPGVGSGGGFGEGQGLGDGNGPGFGSGGYRNETRRIGDPNSVRLRNRSTRRQ